jgi:hypothetical protein
MSPPQKKPQQMLWLSVFQIRFLHRKNYKPNYNYGPKVVAKGDGLEAGFQDGRQFLRSLKRKRINIQLLTTIVETLRF